MQSREDMSLQELLLYHFQGSRVANGGSAPGAPGYEVSVFTETRGGKGYVVQVKTFAWEQLQQRPVVVVETRAGIDTSINSNSSDRFALSHSTYKTIVSLLNGETAISSVVNGRVVSSDAHDKYVNVIADGGASTTAIPWGRASVGRVKLFEINGRNYALNLEIPITISRRTIETTTGTFARPDLNRKVIWYPFGTNNEDLPKQLSYLI